MGWLGLVVVAAAGLGSMRAAIERGDIDEAARQGLLAGPLVIEQALAAKDRPTRLAGIAAASHSPDNTELLESLARSAADPDRRIAIPAAAAARDIARELAAHELPDDLAIEDVAGWRAAFTKLAFDSDRWIELRLLALDTATVLDRMTGTTIDLAAALRDFDPAFRHGAIAVLPMPVPGNLRGALGTAVAKDLDNTVALSAAATLCADLRDGGAPVLGALGEPGIQRIRSLAQGRGPARELRAANLCLSAHKTANH